MGDSHPSAFVWLDQCPWGACVLDADWRVRFWNTHLETWTGVLRQELLDTNVGVRFPRLRQPALVALSAEVWANGEARTLAPGTECLLDLLPGAGQPQALQTRLSLIHDPSAHPQLLLTFNDITAIADELERTRRLQHQAETALRESEERFRLMVDSAPVMLCLSGSDGRFSFFNTPWLEFTGRGLEQELSWGWFAGLWPEDRDVYWQRYAASCHARQPFETEFRLRRADGEFRWILNKGVPRYTPEGHFAGYISSCVDITERKQTEIALARFRAVMNHAGAAIFITDASEGRLIDVNDTACRWLGRPYDEMLKLRACDFADTLNLHVHDPWTLTADDLAFSTRRAVERPHMFKETFQRRRDGSTFPVEILISRKEFQGEQYLLVVARDIAERKRAEESIRASEKKLRQLTRHLHAVREEERKRIAREIHDELGQTLTALKLDLSWLSARKRKRELLPRMSSLIDHAIATVQRISADLRPQVLDDLGLAAALEWHAQQFIRPLGIACRFAADLDRITLAPERAAQMFRIFQEALTNVVRHAGATEVQIELTAENGKLVLKIEDNGRGISPTELADMSSIGLLGMRERARLCEGDLLIEGVSGGGTKVVVTIPLGV